MSDDDQQHNGDEHTQPLGRRSADGSWSPFSDERGTADRDGTTGATEGSPGEGSPGDGFPGESSPGDGFPGESSPGDGFPGEDARHEETWQPGPVMPPPPADDRTAAFPAVGETRRSKKGGRRGVVGIAALALLLGFGGGFAGAAAYQALDEDDGGSSNTPAFTSTGRDSDDEGSDESTRSDVDDSPAPSDGSIESVAQSTLPSVVQINVTTGEAAAPGQRGGGSGSGIILSSDGQILTNNHVVEVAEDGGEVSVSFNDGSAAQAEVLGTDPLTDTALIQAKGVSGLEPATIGSSGKLQVGQDVVAVGSPFGLDATVTTGIVSALDRPVSVGSDEGNSTTYPAIQTDAAINPGNSGGPLVDLGGRVVGINSSIRTAGGGLGGEAGSIGLGFAIPIDEVMPIVEQMANGETPTHARLGVSVGDVAVARLPESGFEGDADELPRVGALVREVPAGGAAADAGLRADDVITRVDETLITGSDSLVATIRSYRPGDEIEVTWVRDGEEQSTTLELGTDADVDDG